MLFDVSAFPSFLKNILGPFNGGLKITCVSRSILASSLAQDLALEIFILLGGLRLSDQNKNGPRSPNAGI